MEETRGGTMNTKVKRNPEPIFSSIKLSSPSYNLRFIEIERREVTADVASRRLFSCWMIG